MAAILSHRVGYVDKPQLPLDRVAKLGITHLEIVMRPEHTAEDVLSIIQPHGLKIGTLSTASPLGVDDYVERFTASADLLQALGGLGHFTSVHAGETPLDVVCERMRAIGDIAAEREQFIAMETHPDLCENGSKAAQTLSAIAHPAVGMNFDTANVYYYNENVDAVEEIKKVARWVRSVHVKDTTGGFKDASFPNVGEGVVDYPGIMAALAAVDFAGPWTLELEGIAGSADSVDKMEANVAACVAHLRKIGLIG